MNVRRRVNLAAALLAGLVALPASAQSAQPAIPPIHPLGRITTVAKVPLDYVATIRPLSDGRVLVLDNRARRVVLFDSTLAHITIVADTTSGTAKAYGARGGWIFPYAGDSSLFADYSSLAFMVVDPGGQLGRIVAAPLGSGGQLAYLNGSMLDPRGYVVSAFPSATAARLGGAGRGGGRGANTGPPPNLAPGASYTTADSSVVVRVNIETKKVDSVVWLTPQTTSWAASTGPGGGIARSALRTPIRVADLWTMMPDGTIAVVRELDYHVDWVAPDGTRTSSPKTQHQWEHLSDSTKAAIMDSVKFADSALTARAKLLVDTLNRSGRDAASRSMQDIIAALGGTLPNGFSISSGPNGTTYGVPSPGPYIDPGDLPDYFPPFATADSTGNPPIKADADGNLWIHANLNKRLDGGSVYDVVSREGKLVERIQIPGGTKLVGFGPGVAYLTSREGTGYLLARARIH